MAEDLPMTPAFTDEPSLDLAGTTLRPCLPTGWVAVAPFRGMERDVEEVLGAPLPPPGTWRDGTHGEVYWAGKDTWIVAGLAAAAGEALLPFALVAEQQSAWAGIATTGRAVRDVLARLTPLDIRQFGSGDVALTEIAHMRGLLIGRRNGVDVLVPRSCADTLAREMTDALRRVAARASHFG